MAVEFKTEHTRSSEYLFLPQDIKIRAEFNGRFKPVSDEEIDERVASFLALGQLQPCLIGNDGGKPFLITGHCRWRAALRINKEKLTEKPFKLRCVYFRGDDRKAYMATLAENRERTPTDDIDDAHGIARLINTFNMSEEEVAAEWHKDVKWVKDRLTLLNLSDSATEAFRGGRIKLSNAALLSKLEREAQDQRVKTAGEGKLTAAVIKGVEVSQNGHAKQKLLTSRVLIDFWKPMAEPPKETAKPVEIKLAKLAALQVALIEGGDKDEIYSDIRALLKGE